MARHLFIMRHAKSAWNTNAKTDFDRPLGKRGIRDAPRMGRRLRKQRLTPDYVVSSPAERAKQTTLRVCQAMGVEKRQISWNGPVYAGSGRKLLKAVSKSPGKARKVLLVGHNPGVDELLTYLCGRKAKIPKYASPLPTAAVAHVEVPGNWKNLRAGKARLVSIERPAS